LKYIDDAGGVKNTAPPRLPSAQAALNAESRAKRLRKNQNFPVSIWVVAFFTLNSGAYRGLGHVVFVRKHSNGTLEIRDSETQAGARAIYRSVAQVNQWFANFSPRYEGWSTHCSGREYARTKPLANKYPRTITVTSTVNVRSKPNLSAPLSGSKKLNKGQTFISVGLVAGTNVSGNNKWHKSQFGNYVWSGNTNVKK